MTGAGLVQVTDAMRASVIDEMPEIEWIGDEPLRRDVTDEETLVQFSREVGSPGANALEEVALAPQEVVALEEGEPGSSAARPLLARVTPAPG